MIQSYAIITGASKGIGRAIALELARRGYSLLLIARSATLLEETAALARKAGAAEVRPMALDLTKAESVTAVLQEVQRNNLPVNVLVNNAGYGAWGRFDTLSLEEQDAMMRINMHVPVELTHGLLPLLKSRQPAYILNVASTAAYQAVATLALYAASKAFILQFSRALRIELKKSGVSVTCLSPGPTETNFMSQAGMHHPKMIQRASKFNMTPEAVAKFAVKGMFAGKNEIIPGVTNSVSALLTALYRRRSPRRSRRDFTRSDLLFLQEGRFEILAVTGESATFAGGFACDADIASVQDQPVVRDGQLVFGNEFYQLSFSLQGVLRPHSQAQPCRNTKHMRIHRDRRQVVHDRRDHVGGLPSYSGELYELLY